MVAVAVCGANRHVRTRSLCDQGLWVSKLWESYGTLVAVVGSDALSPEDYRGIQGPGLTFVGRQRIRQECVTLSHILAPLESILQLSRHAVLIPNINHRQLIHPICILKASHEGCF